MTTREVYAGSDWDEQAATLDDARHAVWGTDPWDQGVAMCLDRITPVLDEVGHAGGRILDLGCGVGRLLHPLAERWPSATLVGFDISSEMLRHAAAQYAGGDIRLCHGSWQQLHLARQCDGAFSVLMFQHLSHMAQRSYLGALAQQLRPGAPFVLQFVPYGDEGPLNHPVAPSTMAIWCEAAGLEVTDIATPPQRPTWLWLTARRRETSET